MTVENVNIDERGLSAAEVAERVARGAVNRVKDRTSRSVASIIRENVLTLFNAIIVAASVIVRSSSQRRSSFCSSETCATAFSAAS